MKATLWLFSSLATILCASQIVNGSSYSEYRYSRQMPTNQYLDEKRTIPSLSIVNPVDVLRQRLMLEMVRRQMKETNAKIERNRQILKSVGKRRADFSYYDYDRSPIIEKTHPANSNHNNNNNDLISSNQDFLSSESQRHDYETGNMLKPNDLQQFPSIDTNHLTLEQLKFKNNPNGRQQEHYKFQEITNPSPDYPSLDDLVKSENENPTDDDYQTRYLYRLQNNLLSQQ